MSRTDYRRAYIGGTFDCLHRGHLALFAKARTVAKEVVVSVNTDEFTTKYKRTPMMTLADRVAVLEQCRLVDDVIVNVGNEDSKIAIVSANVDCIVHGDDWQGESLMKQMGFDQEWLDFCGISLVILPYTPYVSTSKILESYKDRNVIPFPDDTTTCKTCNRAVMKEHVDADGNCSTCSVSEVHAPTEEEWVDLGRPEA